MRRSVVAFGALVYALALVTYTLLPLPNDVSTVCRSVMVPQIRPFAFVEDIAKEGGLDSPRAIVANPAAAQVLFNVLLFVPLGALVRYAVARRRPFVGLLIGLVAGLVVSLLIETTQLTGDWFLYPCAYRLFDVDDLIANTTGAVIGTLLAPMIALVAGRGDSAAADVPRPVTTGRRLSGMLADAVATWLTTGGLSVAIAIGWALADGTPGDGTRAVLIAAAGFVAPASQLGIVLVSGRTLGEHVVRLRPVPDPAAGRRLLRWALGSGGWGVLIAVDVPAAGFVAFLLAVVSVIAVWTTRDRRGLALACIDTAIEDDRAP